MVPRAFLRSGSLTRSILASVENRNSISIRVASTQSTKPQSSAPEAKNEAKDNLNKEEAVEEPKKKKTQAELDEELRQKLEGIAGDGGEAGMELENGQPVSMKRGVKNNMFRYI